MGTKKSAAQFRFETSFFAGDISGMKEALSLGAWVDSPIEGISALAFAAKYGWTERAACLVDLGADPWCSLSYAPSSSAPLHAIRRGDQEMLNLFKSKSKLNMSPEDSMRVLLLSVSDKESRSTLRKRAKMALELMPNQPARKEALADALMEKWRFGEANDSMRALLDAGADPWEMVDLGTDDDFSLGADEDHGGDTLEDHADRVPLVVGLADIGKAELINDLNVEFEDTPWARKAVELALSHFDDETLAVLLRRGCKPSLFPLDGVDMFERLCMDDMDSYEENPGVVQCVKLLVEHGLPLEGLPKGRTLLMMALGASNIGVAMALLDLGANPLAKNGSRGVASMAKSFLSEPDFARAYGSAIARKEAREMQESLPEVTSSKRGARI